MRLTSALIGIMCACMLSAAEMYPLEYFAQRDTINNVQLSPNGEKLGLLKIAGKESNPVLEIYQVKDLTQKPFRIDADPMELVRFSWLSDDDILLNLRQKVRDKIDGFNRGVYEGKLAKLDLRSKKIKEFKEVNARVVNLLPKKPNKIIISFNADAPKGNKIPNTIRPAKYYEFDLVKGTKKLLLIGKIEQANYRFDGDGNPRISTGFDLSKRELVYYYKSVGDKDWTEIHRKSEDSFESFNINGIDDQKPDHLFVTAHNGMNTASLWEFNAKSKSFGERIYGRTDVDVLGTLSHSNAWDKPDLKVGIIYATDKYHNEYFDAEEAQLYEMLKKSIPYAYNVQFSSRSEKNNGVVALNSGPQDPGTYYLLRDGKLLKIGSKQPKMEGKNLSQVKYIKYKSRDGKIIPAYITVPAGDGPFPTIVMPHGGPFVQEVVGYDEWGQLLANQGYLVLQPQYRGSRGYGLKFYQSAFMEGGQGGYKMQDDKDDGIQYLVKKGLTDPDRVAMFGWSYGGYAALVAASREPQIYQCVIAGAAVSDPIMQVNYYRDRASGAQKLEQERMWLDSISPYKEAEKVNVPLLLIHGDVDQRVPLAHAKKYLKKLQQFNKSHEYVELVGADHFSNTLFYRHQIKLYESMISYLKNDCGPGGL